MEKLTSFGQELKLQRLRGRIKLKDLAAKLQISSPYISIVENDHRPVSEEFAFRCIDAMETLMGANFDRQRLVAAAYGSMHTLDVKDLSVEDRSRIGLEVLSLRGDNPAGAVTAT